MSERLDPQPSCFPVTREIVQRVVPIIQADLATAFTTEVEFIQADQEVNLVVFVGARTIKDGHAANAYCLGAAFTHRLIREQAEALGTTLPRLHNGDGNRYLLKSVTQRRNNLTGFFEQNFDRLPPGEQPLKDALEQVCTSQYRIYFLGGAADLYLSIRSTQTKPSSVWVREV